MTRYKATLASVLALILAAPASLPGANHREAPITALDHKADITDIYAFRSYGPDSIDKVTFIMGVDPLLEPGNGPSFFPFDPDILYEIKIDNNRDALADVIFQFRFSTEQRLPGIFTVYAGIGSGMGAVPPRINDFNDAGLGLRQAYTVRMIKGGSAQTLGTSPMYAVPSNAGTRTMDYPALYDAGTYSLQNGIKVFAGTTDDAFWIDLGGAFDTLNTAIGAPVLSAAQDVANQNFAADFISGYNVNTIAIEVPISMVTSDGSIPNANAANSTIGIWATTSRPRTTVRRSPNPEISSGSFLQVQRMGNPLINELLVGTGSKDRFSMDQPVNDAQFAPFFLEPTLPVVVNSLTGLAVPSTPRTDLLPVVQYHPPIAAPGPAGPVADLLRLNLGVPPTHPSVANRMGLLGGDPAGFPNGRRVFDDVTDAALRLVVGGVLTGMAPFNAPPYTLLGDGVNVNDVPYVDRFPYVGYAHAGNARRHIDPGEDRCTMNSGGPCAPAQQ